MRRAKAEEKLQYWRGILRELESSRLPVSKFCRKRGVSQGSIWYWRKREREERESREAVFLPVRLSEQETVSSKEQELHEVGRVRILISGRSSVEVSDGFSATSLDRVIAVLEARLC